MDLRLCFGACVLDLDTRELFREGHRVPLSPKGFRLLEVLLERRPSAVAQEAIHDLVWPKTFVSPSSLTRIVAEVRERDGAPKSRSRRWTNPTKKLCR